MAASASESAPLPAFFNAAAFSSEKLHTAKISWQSCENTPYEFAVLDDVVDTKTLQKLKKGLKKATWVPKQNDLYHFQQTDALMKASDGILQTTREALYSPGFKSALETISSIDLADTVDISAASYSQGSYLLPHDDDLSERRIAFIVYLVSADWTAADGGHLDLYACDSNGAPSHVVHSIIPAPGRLVMFNVRQASWHAVTEVLSSTKGPRMSISGWYHGNPVPRAEPYMPSPPMQLPPIPIEDVDSALPAAYRLGSLTSWINPTYLRPQNLAQMAEQFVDTAHLQLNDFLLPDVYTALLKDCGMQRWERVGPAYVRCHAEAALPHAAAWADRDCSSASIQPSVSERFMALLGTDAWHTWLSAATGGAELGSSATAMRAFGHRDYTLVCDEQYTAARVAAKRARFVAGEADEGTAADGEEDMEESADSFVDTTLCVVPPTSVGHDGEWPTAAGGHVTWLTMDEELLTVPVRPNALTIIAAEPGMHSFVKYMSAQAPAARVDVHQQAKVGAWGNT